MNEPPSARIRNQRPNGTVMKQVGRETKRDEVDQDGENRGAESAAAARIIPQPVRGTLPPPTPHWPEPGPPVPDADTMGAEAAAVLENALAMREKSRQNRKKSQAAQAAAKAKRGKKRH